MIPNPEWIKKIFKLGLPTSLEMSSRSFGMFLMMFIVSTFGTTATAAYGIGTKILGFIIIPAIGFSIATSTLIGNNIGARQHKRAEEISITAIKVGFFTLFTIGILIFISAEKISTFFVPNEPELIKIASLFIKIISTGFGLIGIQMVIGGTLKGAGKTKTSMFLTMGQTFTLFVSAYILAVIFKLNEFGIWLAYPIANILITCLEFYLYKQKSWLKSYQKRVFISTLIMIRTR
jgi:Na+-driven multidrug efflux pump